MKNKVKKFIVCFILIFFLTLTGCQQAVAPTGEEMVQSSIVSLNKSLYLRVGNKEIEIIVINPELVEQLDDYLPLTLNLNGNEVYADLPFEINVESDDVGSIQEGDVMLFGNQILVIFYQSHPTTYRYTKIGKIKDMSQLKDGITSREIELIYK